MWKVTQHKTSSQPQEMKVIVLVKEMAQYTFATYAGEFISHFESRIKEIPRTNIFSADLLYKMTQRNLKSVEVWKMTSESEFKYKIFTLDFIENNK